MAFVFELFSVSVLGSHACLISAGFALDSQISPTTSVLEADTEL